MADGFPSQQEKDKEGVRDVHALVGVKMQPLGPGPAPCQSEGGPVLFSVGISLESSGSLAGARTAGVGEDKGQACWGESAPRLSRGGDRAECKEPHVLHARSGAPSPGAPKGSPCRLELGARGAVAPA